MRYQLQDEQEPASAGRTGADEDGPCKISRDGNNPRQRCNCPAGRIKKKIDVTTETAPEAPPAIIPQAVPQPLKSPKPKTTLNLNGLIKPATAVSVEEKPEEIAAPPANKVVRVAQLQAAWDEYTERRKDQAAEYQILKREIQFKHPVISVLLTNPVEETLLENIRRDFIQFLRDRLQNNELTLSAALQESLGKKIIYTGKEKFEHMARKNPYLNELKDKLGLDWDF